MTSSNRLTVFTLLWLLARGSAAAATVCDGAAPTARLTATLCQIANPPDAESTRLHGVLVEQGGKILAERYFHSQDWQISQIWSHSVNFDANTLHDLRSVSKSVVSLLLGIALQQGKIASLDTPVLDYFPQQAAELPDVAAKRKITLRHLLTMSAGLNWDEDGGGLHLSDQFKMEWSRDMVAYVLQVPVAQAPGRQYQYNSGCTVLLGAVLEQVSGMALNDYAAINLFRPLGITQTEWQTARKGKPMAHAGLRLTPRDLARIGRMVQDGGRWQGRQIVSAAWLRESTQGYLAAEGEWQYGYFWRTGSYAMAGKNWRWIGAMGNGGQRLIIVPALDVVLVIIAGRYNAAGPDNYLPSNRLVKRIIEAVVQAGAAGVVVPDLLPRLVRRAHGPPDTFNYTKTFDLPVQAEIQAENTGERTRST